MEFNICGRCYEETEKLFPANCDENPELKNKSIGQYHCPDCGAMIFAGMKHPQMCQLCIDREHPKFDITGG